MKHQGKRYRLQLETMNDFCEVFHLLQGHSIVAELDQFELTASFSCPTEELFEKIRHFGEPELVWDYKMDIQL